MIIALVTYCKNIELDCRRTSLGVFVIKEKESGMKGTVRRLITAQSYGDCPSKDKNSQSEGTGQERLDV